MELSDWIKQLQVKDCLELAIKYTLREFRDTTHPSALHAAFREIKNLTEFDDCDYEADSIQVAYLYDFHAKRIHDSIQVLSMFRRITEESEQFIDFGCGCGANIVGIACYRDYLYSFEKEDHVREKYTIYLCDKSQTMRLGCEAFWKHLKIHADRNTNTRKCGLDLRSETVNVKWIDEFDSAGDKVALIGSYPFSLADTYNPEVSAKLILDIIKKYKVKSVVLWTSKSKPAVLEAIERRLLRMKWANVNPLSQEPSGLRGKLDPVVKEYRHYLLHTKSYDTHHDDKVEERMHWGGAFSNVSCLSMMYVNGQSSYEESSRQKPFVEYYTDDMPF